MADATAARSAPTGMWIWPKVQTRGTVCSAEDRGALSPVAVDTSRHHSSLSTHGLDAETYLGEHLQAAEVGRNTWRHRPLVDAAAAAARFRLAGRLRDGAKAGLRFGAHRAHLLAQLPHLLHLELAERNRLETQFLTGFCQALESVSVRIARTFQQ